MNIKPYPKSRAGRRTVPLPTLVRAHLAHQRQQYGLGAHGEVFVNEAGNPLRRGLFRTRIWRPSLVRAGLLGSVVADHGHFRASWTTQAVSTCTSDHPTASQAVHAVARAADGGLRFPTSVPHTPRG